MKNKNVTRLFVLILILLFAGLPAARPTTASSSDVNAGTAPAAPAQMPKLFWYAQTFGETEKAYFADTDHLYNPEGVGVDGSGNIWIAETLGARVLKFSGAGQFLMSIGEAGRVWLADNMHISVPIDVAVDGAGNVWVVDQASNRVVKYDPNGNYLAQLGVTWEGGDDNAHFSCPFSIAFDSSGKIYVSDACNNRIQVFNSSLSYLTSIGVTGVPGTDNAHFKGQWRITIDSSDNLYVADLGNERVQIFDSGHNYLATLGVTGVAGDDNSHFNNPRGVAVDTDHIYVADGGNNRIQIFNRGTRSYEATLGNGPGLDYSFNWPGDVVVDSAGNIYVADELYSRVQKFDSSRTFVRTYGTTGVPYLTDNSHYNMPTGVAVDANGNIGIVEDERRGHRFIKLNASGVAQFSIGVAGVKGGDESHFGNPTDVAYDANGNIYIVDQWNHRIQIFSSNGTYQNTLGVGWGAGNNQFKFPTGVAVDSIGNIYVADTENHRVQIYDSSRIFIATLGVTGVSGNDNAHFNRPYDVAVDTSGNIYVADTENIRVQKFNQQRVWQMTLGTTGVWGNDSLHFSLPVRLAADSQGNLYVTDLYNNRVQVFSSNGSFRTTIGGSWGNGVDQFRHPTGVAVDGEGNVYIADKHNHRIEKYEPGKLVYLPLVQRSIP